MSASTDQKVLQIVESLRSRGEFLEEGYGLDIDKTVEFVKSAITQAIAVETAVLRDALQRLDHAIGGDADEILVAVAHARSVLSATDSPGAKAEDTASAEFLKKALDQAIDIGEYLADEVGVISDYMCCQVSDASESPDLYTYLRTKEQP